MYNYNQLICKVLFKNTTQKTVLPYNVIVNASRGGIEVLHMLSIYSSIEIDT